ncbi:TIR domain protein [Nonomuraea coxensis DSM 45129]|uniref:TIR domain protein n=1 Tax=Nonomuraea coxensis DSM 45129 TaxID=1122611 RepID=A0ABX8U0Z4_9ACTN|nr:toll/interleukin-1 receptor domain-containing protein [Nonomuraea coxensis]QYC41330.1 TIR domain protein [Nonomuraea coxensis DSM 45129]
MSTWQASDARSWTFTEKLITGYGGGLGDYGSSYALDVGSGLLLNGRVSATLRLIRGSGVGAGLVCRADGSWNFVAFYTAPEDAGSEVTYARFGVYQEGILTNTLSSEEPVVLGTGFNRFSLEFFSGDLRGEIHTEKGVCELRTTCVQMPFPGHAGLLRLYGAGLMAKDVVVQPTTIRLSQEAAPAEHEEDRPGFDVFLCHAGADKETVKDIARELAAGGITYWLDAEQFSFGDRVAEKIEDGLRRSRYVVPCLSAAFAASGWTRGEYNAVLNAELSGDTMRTVIPLVLDDSDAANVPLLLRDKRRAYYANKTEWEHFLRFLGQGSPPSRRAAATDGR